MARASRSGAKRKRNTTNDKRRFCDNVGVLEVHDVGRGDDDHDVDDEDKGPGDDESTPA